MSTALKIIEHEKAGRLCRLLPLFRGAQREVRMISVKPDLHAWINDDGTANEFAKIKGQIRGQLGEFIRGEEIDNEVFMKRVEDRRNPSKAFHHGVWSIRARFERPQYRLFGMFALTDWFVAFSKQDRDSLEKEAGWHGQIDLCKALWSRFFPDQLPITGNDLYRYISENVENWDDRW